MFIIIDGTMGSGKSYYAVDYIFKNMQKYYKVFTNINNFQFQYNIEKLDMDIFTNTLFAVRDVHYDKTLNDVDFYSLLVKEGVSDPLILEDFDSSKPSLIVIDECQRWFKKPSDIHNFLIEYSRHMNLHIILITQSYKILHRDLPALTDYLLHAISSSKRFRLKVFKYQKYVGVPFYKDTLDSSFTLSFDPRIAELYKSGGGVGVSSVIVKHLLKFILLLVFVVFAFIYFLYSNYLSTSAPDNIHTKKKILPSVEKKIDNQSKVINNLSDFSLISFSCIKQVCSYKKVLLSSVDLDSLIKFSGSKILSKKRIDSDIFVINLLASSSFFDVLNLNEGGPKNEKSVISFNPFGK